VGDPDPTYLDHSFLMLLQNLFELGDVLLCTAAELDRSPR
jgi:hypothetical protein